MKRSKTQKGITLVALIITIIVLLILAIVTIGAIQEDGIIQYAKNTREAYETAQTNEQEQLQGHLAKLPYGGDSNTGTGEGETLTGTWTQNGTEITNEAGKKIYVGDTVNYVSNAQITVYSYEYDEGGMENEIKTKVKYEDAEGAAWKVLGAENGQILLMSTIDIDKLGGTELDDEIVEPTVGELTNKCIPLGNGTYAAGARSIKVEDINRVTGYQPSNEKEVTFTLGDRDEEDFTHIYYQVKDGESGTLNKEYYSGMFSTYDNQTLTKDNPITLTVNHYEYYPNTLTESSTGETLGIDKESREYKMLFGSANYWLASTSTGLKEDIVTWYMRSVQSTKVTGGLLLTADGGFEMIKLGVRAVVTLESDVKLTPNGANSWTLSK